MAVCAFKVSAWEGGGEWEMSMVSVTSRIAQPWIAAQERANAEVEEALTTSCKISDIFVFCTVCISFFVLYIKLYFVIR